MEWISSTDTIETPALIYDENKLWCSLDAALLARDKAGSKLLYAVKAASPIFILDRLAPHLDGFSVSSLFEAKLVRGRFPDVEVHFTSPGIRDAEVHGLGRLCQFVAVNSRSQVHRYATEFACVSSFGVRVNTRISHVDDERYNPCRPGSKLGIPLEELPKVMAESPVPPEGLHFHTNSDSTDFGELLTNVEALLGAVPNGCRFKWVNLGGGYLFGDDSATPLVTACAMIRERLGATVYLEPGAGLIRAAGFLVASVLDIFDVDGRNIAVLDTTVNHIPEVLEFDYKPEVYGTTDNGIFAYDLVGSTCLAGDVFGTYRLPEPLDVGDRVVFEEVGAYALAKAHRFNGVNLPTVGYMDSSGRYEIQKTFDYADYSRYWESDEALPV